MTAPFRAAIREALAGFLDDSNRWVYNLYRSEARAVVNALDRLAEAEKDLANERAMSQRQFDRINELGMALAEAERKLAKKDEEIERLCGLYDNLGKINKRNHDRAEVAEALAEKRGKALQEIADLTHYDDQMIFEKALSVLAEESTND